MASESIRSNMPPCPGIKLPVSFKPISRLIAETITSPINPPKAISAPAKSDSMAVNGVKNRIKYATTIVVIKPPMKPSHVLLGLIFSIILFFLQPEDAWRIVLTTNWSFCFF